MSRQSDTKTSKQVRIDEGLHRELKMESIARGETIKGLLDSILTDFLAEESVSQGFRALGGRNEQ